MEFDLVQIDTKTLSESGVAMPLKTLGGDVLLARNGAAVTLRLLGPDSNKYRTLTRAQVRRRMDQMAAGKTSLTEAEVDELERDVLDVLTACTVGWENVLDTEGNEIPYSEDNVRKLYSSYPVVREQVDSFVSNRANFIRAS